MSNSFVSFYFHIVDMAPAPNTRPREEHGVWLPPVGNASRIVSHHLFCFNGMAVYDLGNVAEAPEGSEVYSTRSLYHYSSTFWALNYDATVNSVNYGHFADWNHVGFDHGDRTINWVGFAGEQRRLGLQREQPWVHTLLPENHQPYEFSMDGRYGGLSGELSVLIALIAFSIRPEWLFHGLNNCMRQGQWGGHQHRHGRIDGRGMVVKVYTMPGMSTAQELREFEATRIFPA
ncbi:hypothetical protein DBV05_g3137 [Lasiodiplodia theobromae]|uniref:Uncharacterized protein n=1 Tax=Lasiodiplodia theobromae TaxID=45133 RepID=A0A5N5DMF0_9PEZI|nr:hypothetical protein DBV05_g3137 [Lasiodiplodia theobromae]